MASIGKCSLGWIREHALGGENTRLKFILTDWEKSAHTNSNDNLVHIESTS